MARIKQIRIKAIIPSRGEGLQKYVRDSEILNSRANIPYLLKQSLDCLIDYMNPKYDELHEMKLAYEYLGEVDDAD